MNKGQLILRLIFDTKSFNLDWMSIYMSTVNSFDVVGHVIDAEVFMFAQTKIE